MDTNELENYLNGPLRDRLEYLETYEIIQHLDKDYFLISPKKVGRVFRSSSLIDQLDESSKLRSQLEEKILFLLGSSLSRLGYSGITFKFNKKSLRVNLTYGPPKTKKSISFGRHDYLSELPLDLKIIVATQDYQVFKKIYQTFEDVKKYYLEFSRLLINQKDKFTVRVELEDRTEYTLDGKLHRELDQPAVVYKNYRQEWWYNGELFRENDKPTKILEDGTQEWYSIGNLHRGNDKPAVIRAADPAVRRPGGAGDVGTQEWYSHGKKHRERDQPAYIGSDGRREWWYYGSEHRENDQPAKIGANGGQEWWVNGLLHRENDQPAKIYPNGGQEWYFNGKVHRENDRPAKIYPNGRQQWYFQGRLHRENDLPAVIESDNSQSWWVNGRPHRGNDLPAVVRADGTQHGTAFRRTFTIGERDDGG